MLFYKITLNQNLHFWHFKFKQMSAKWSYQGNNCIFSKFYLMSSACRLKPKPIPWGVVTGFQLAERYSLKYGLTKKSWLVYEPLADDVFSTNCNNRYLTTKNVVCIVSSRLFFFLNSFTEKTRGRMGRPWRWRIRSPRGPLANENSLCLLCFFESSSRISSFICCARDTVGS